MEYGIKKSPNNTPDEAIAKRIRRYRQGSAIGRLTQKLRALFISEDNNGVSSDWKHRFNEMNSRLNVYKDLFFIHDTGEHPFSRKIMLIDSMLDKAQVELGRRAKHYFIPGILLLIMTIFMMGAFIIYFTFSDGISCLAATNGLSFISITSTNEHPNTDISKKLINMYCNVQTAKNVYDFILIFAKRLVIGGSTLALAYVFFSNATACFRESTRLLHRRHSVRYIRLLLYNSDGLLENKELRDAFGIDDVTSSGFDTIKTEAVQSNLISKAIEALGGLKDIKIDIGGGGSKSSK